MTLNPTRWKAVVDRKRIKSRNFKALDRAVGNYMRLGSTEIGNVRTAWDAWTSKFAAKGRNFRRSDRYVPGGALEDLAVLMGAAAPTSHEQLLEARDAVTPDVRPGGNRFVAIAGGFKQQIFTQEEQESCTCACATTFLTKLTGTPISEDAFKVEFGRVNKTNHDFSRRGTTLEPIYNTLLSYDADVVHHETPTWDDMKAFLDNASHAKPVMIGVIWDGGVGGHAVICVGQGTLPGWNGIAATNGYIMEDPYPTHRDPGLTTAGEYYVNAGHNTVHRADAALWAGCITGKRAPREYGKMASHKKVGVKLMV